MTPTNIKVLRKCLGLSQEKFAAVIQSTFVSVNRWEQGHQEPGPHSLVFLELLRQAVALHPPESVLLAIRGLSPIDTVKVLCGLTVDDGVPLPDGKDTDEWLAREAERTDGVV